MEVRNLTQAPMMEKESRTIKGTAVVFNSRSEQLGDFTEFIDPHAFDDVDMSDVVLLYNHDSGSVLARTSANTLKLNLDERGLHFEADIPETTLGNDTLTNLRNKNISGMSFGFDIADDDWEDTSNGYVHYVRKINHLYEISVVTFPAYKATDVEASTRLLTGFKEIEKEKVWIKSQLSNLEEKI